VLSYQNFGDTDECLESLLRQDYPRHRIIVVDNGSGDDSLTRLKQKWDGQAAFIETGANLGVAGGYNAGIRMALAEGAGFVVLCNNDIVVESGFLRTLLGVFAAYRHTAIAVPVMVYYDRPDLIWFARVAQQKYLRYSINELRGRRVSELEGRRGAVYTSDYVPTCASMLSRPALERVGLLDERFFFGHDDVDWSLRAFAAGFACNVIGEPLVRHKVSVTSGIRGSNALTPSSAYTHAVGSVLIGAKHFRNLAAIPFFVGLFAIRAPYNVAVMALAGGWQSVRSYLRGLFDGARLYGPSAFGEEPAEPAYDRAAEAP
jgi:GT2 family glycosyltransferase